MPESWRSAGVLMAPAARMTSRRAEAVKVLPALEEERNWMPVARTEGAVPVRRTFVT